MSRMSRKYKEFGEQPNSIEDEDGDEWYKCEVCGLKESDLFELNQCSECGR